MLNRTINQIIGERNQNDLNQVDASLEASVNSPNDSTSESTFTQATAENIDCTPQNASQIFTEIDSNIEAIQVDDPSNDLVDNSVPTICISTGQEQDQETQGNTDQSETAPKKEPEPIFNYFSSSNVSVNLLVGNAKENTRNASQHGQETRDADDCVLLGDFVPAPLPSTTDWLAKRQNDPISGNKPFNTSVSISSTNMFLFQI